MNKKKESAGYPTLKEYKTKSFLNIAAAVGIGVSAAAISLDVEAGEKKAEKTKKVEKNEKNEKKGAQDQIILLAVNLGHKDFKIREKSMQSLISMGEKLKKEKKTKLTEFLKSELEKCKKSEDPEVKDRTKKILIALTPPPPQIPTERKMGEIQIMGDPAF